MCVSAPVSFAMSATLLPLGVYSVNKAKNTNPPYLPFAAFPLAFGIQQQLEGIVWLNIDSQSTNILYTAALGFLFFSHFFWPSWAPFSVYYMEKNVHRRRILGAFTVIGVLFGASLYLPIVFNDWVEVGISGASIEYDTRLLYDKWVPTEVVRWFYVAVVVPPFFIVQQKGVRIFGILLAISLILSFMFFDYAFISVWCFFAALISLYIAFHMHQLSEKSRKIHS